jgi:hypothetical protein
VAGGGIVNGRVCVRVSSNHDGERGLIDARLARVVDAGNVGTEGVAEEAIKLDKGDMIVANLEVGWVYN